MSRFTASDYEIWMHRKTGEMQLWEWNVCGCHHRDLIYTKGPQNSFWLPGKNRKVEVLRMKKQGWILLDSGHSKKGKNE